MRLVRIGAASISVKVGAFKSNLERIKEVIRRAVEEEVSLLCLPELCITGYMLEDRVQWPEVSERAWDALSEIARLFPEIAVFSGLPVRINGILYNGLALTYGGEPRGIVLKRFLPSYDVFYEGRNFTPWRGTRNLEVNGIQAGDILFKLPFGNVSAQICEDAWIWPQENLSLLLKAEVLCNASASPFTLFKEEKRRRLILSAAEKMLVYHAFANLVGLDSARLVFDGGALIASPEGIVAEGPALHKEPWRLVTCVADLDEVTRMRSENTTWREAAAREIAKGDVGGTIDLCSEGGRKSVFLPPRDYPIPATGSFFLGRAGDSGQSVYGLRARLDKLMDALVLGIRDYYVKAGAFRKILVALSGGKDSALALIAGVEAIKAIPSPKNNKITVKGRVEARYLSGPYSSGQTLEAARELCRELGVPFSVVSIDGEYELAVKMLREMGKGKDPSPLALQNAQARIRGAMMLGWANTMKGLILVTSNLSEVAVGYFTTGGDNQGGFSPLADIPKTLIKMLLERARERYGLKSLDSIIAQIPTAELADGQSDEEDLMPYEVLDDILYLYARRKLKPGEILEVLAVKFKGIERKRLRSWLEKFLQLFNANQWKREQSPVALKLLELDLDPKTGFRYPVIQDGDERTR